MDAPSAVRAPIAHRPPVRNDAAWTIFAVHLSPLLPMRRLLCLTAALLALAAPARTQTLPDSSAALPPADSAAVDPFADLDPFAGLDTLGGAAPRTLADVPMSRWERVWWGERGAMRRVGLAPVRGDGGDLRRMGQTRRRMLAAHQIVALGTLASMTVTVASGVEAFDGSGGGLHRASLPFTIGGYTTAAALAFLSPPPAYRAPGRRRLDTITVHRYLAAVHLVGMTVTPLVAPRVGNWDRRHVHRAAGYATYASYAAAMAAVTFFR